jgi:hypothetical protein
VGDLELRILGQPLAGPVPGPAAAVQLVTEAPLSLPAVGPVA